MPFYFSPTLFAYPDNLRGIRYTPLRTSSVISWLKWPRFFGSNEILIVWSAPGNNLPLVGTALKLAA